MLPSRSLRKLLEIETHYDVRVIKRAKDVLRPLIGRHAVDLFSHRPYLLVRLADLSYSTEQSRTRFLEVGKRVNNFLAGSRCIAESDEWARMGRKVVDHNTNLLFKHGQNSASLERAFSSVLSHLESAFTDPNTLARASRVKNTQSIEYYPIHSPAHSALKGVHSKLVFERGKLRLQLQRGQQALVVTPANKALEVKPVGEGHSSISSTRRGALHAYDLKGSNDVLLERGAAFVVGGHAFRVSSVSRRKLVLDGIISSEGRTEQRVFAFKKPREVVIGRDSNKAHIRLFA